MQRITIKAAGIKPSLYRKIRAWGIGAMYRVNAHSADLYTFELDAPDDPRHSWSGGWGWSNDPETWSGHLAINLQDGELYQTR